MVESFYKHQRIVEDLGREIRTGELPSGSRLPGEQALTQRFSVSRTTVRQALGALSEQGLIATRAGLGSFVTFDGSPLDNRIGWTQALAENGATLRTAVLALQLTDEPELAGRIGTDSTRFLATDRVRRLPEGGPVSLERSRVPLRTELVDVPERGLTNGSLTTTLREAGIVAVAGDEWAEVMPLPVDEAQVLEREVSLPFLRLLRLSRDRAGAPVEHVVSLLDPEHFRLHLQFGETGGPQ